ncbi:MAG: FtsX-like permease family protein [Lachnospiraceae bacterium]|nr:FtsX-like permease family protein [Lachnospiraceae bacterium]
MKYWILLKQNSKRHRGTLLALFILVGILAIVLSTTISLWINSGNYVRQEMERMGFGNLTAWISGTEDDTPLIQEIESLNDISKVEGQQLIFSEYEINGMESDSEGQLILYGDEHDERYRFFNEDLSGYQSEDIQITPGDIYLPTSMVSMFGAQTGNELMIRAARNGKTKTFRVAGFYEDPFMGSTMIGMKGFLISGQDYKEIVEEIRQSGIDALARTGWMLHVFQEEGSSLTVSELNQLLNEETSLSEHFEFVHSFESILGFMMILQNAFLGFIIVFAGILLIITMIVLSHSMNGILEQEKENIRILKTLGFTDGMLLKVHILQYLIPIIFGLMAGFFASFGILKRICRMTLSTTGLLIPSRPQVGWCILAFLGITLLLLVYLIFKLNRASKKQKDIKDKAFYKNPIKREELLLTIGFRQILSGKKHYVSIFITAMLLVCFASLMGRLNSWLGPNGEGMMDAFNPADHHLGVQSMGDVTRGEFESFILQYTDIMDVYELAMPDISLNGVNYTANVITEPERFHILQGEPCLNDDEIVLTEYLAEDWNIGIGDSVVLQAGAGRAEYRVSGIYQCANDMGANLGMSKEGYLKIGQDSPNLWCIHYFFSDASKKSVLMDDLEGTYGSAVHVHENSWPGLYGILAAMHMILWIMYGTAALFILVVVWLSGNKVIYAEQKDIGIYKMMGFSEQRLRCLFTLRFGGIACVGALIGIALSAMLTDPAISFIMKIFGISNFESHPGLIEVMTPMFIIAGMFILCAYSISVKLKKIDISLLVAE